MLERGRYPNFALEARELAEAYSWSNHFSKLEIFLKETIEQNGCPSSS
jgi:hypothetical protein